MIDFFIIIYFFLIIFKLQITGYIFFVFLFWALLFLEIQSLLNWQNLTELWDFSVFLHSSNVINSGMVRQYQNLQLLNNFTHTRVDI